MGAGGDGKEEDRKWALVPCLRHAIKLLRHLVLQTTPSHGARAVHIPAWTVAGVVSETAGTGSHQPIAMGPFIQGRP